MSAFVHILLALILMILLLRKRIHISYAALAAALLLFVLSGMQPSHLGEALYHTLASWTTWDMVFTLFFVMCLEHILRTSGILKDFTVAVSSLFHDNRIVLAFLPAFLGFLPSLGGAIFSAPMVEEAARPYQLTPERKTAINYWFRHVWEFSNPILPSLLLAATLTGIPIGLMIRHQFVLSFAAIAIGAVVMLRGAQFQPSKEAGTESGKKSATEVAAASAVQAPDNQRKHLRAVLLAIGPILLNVLLVTIAHLNTTLSMLLIVLLLTAILHYRPLQWLNMLRDGLNLPIITSILSILFFQGMLYATGTIDGLIVFFQESGIPAAAVVYLTAFFMGLLTGLSQGVVAIAFPLLVPLLGPNLDAVALTLLCGLTGTMLSPAHLCLIMTVEYFHASLLGTLKPVAIAQFSLLAFAFAWMLLL